jgi:mannosyl-oligosaccharide glucosidase
MSCKSNVFAAVCSAILTYSVPVANALTAALQQAKSKFYPRFEASLQPKTPFAGTEHANFSQSLLSNLLGGIGYFFGSGLVDTSNQSEYEEEAIKTPTHSVNGHTKPASTRSLELFSCVPSRSNFPRGFLWDEGFHQLLVLEWDLDLSIEMLQSWLTIMDEHGWIAREYILGPEARSKVPHEFQVMYPHHANPPTLFLAAKAITGRLHRKVPYHGVPSMYLDNKDATAQLLQKLLVGLKKHYFWFRDTQKGSATSANLSEHRHAAVYRWRGRTSQHILASGLDDYPRSQPPSLEELHVDAASWVGLMATVLRDMSKALDRNEYKEFETHRLAIRAALDDIYWSSEDRGYCDVAPKDKAFSKVCHIGYVSLMPFLVGLLEHDHPNLGHVLDMIRDEKKLWSHYGLRSLSLSDEFYGKDENYWRGPIWINVNFLAIQRLMVRRKRHFQQRMFENLPNHCRKYL